MYSSIMIIVCSRAFIQHALDEPNMAVPSPTYLLQNIYDELEGNAETHSNPILTAPC